MDALKIYLRRGEVEFLTIDDMLGYLRYRRRPHVKSLAGGLSLIIYGVLYIRMCGVSHHKRHGTSILGCVHDSQLST